MTDRRTFLGSLFAPLLGWFRKKPAPGPLPTERVRIASADGLRSGFIEFPERIENMTFVRHELYVQTKSGLYQVMGDGTYQRLDHAPFVIVRPLKVRNLIRRAWRVGSGRRWAGGPERAAFNLEHLSNAIGAGVVPWI